LNNIENQTSYCINLIIECCKDNPKESKIKNSILFIEDWEKFIFLANKHGVLPLVYKVFNKYSNLISSYYLLILKNYYLEITAENMGLTKELIQIANILSTNDINYFTFKGPTLSFNIFGDITMRQYSDIDIMIEKKDLEKAISLIKNHGYEDFLNLTQEQFSFRKNNSHEYSLINKKKGVLLELHWSFLDNDHPTNIDNFINFSDLKKVLIVDKKLNILNNEELLIYLCIHGINHLFERVEWLVDIDRLIKLNNIDWSRVDKLIASSFEVKKSFYISLSYVNSLLGTAIPNKYINSYKKENLILKTYLLREKKLFKKLLFKSRFFTKATSKLKFLHKVIFKPTLNELRVIKLPRKIYFMYYLIRIYLILKKI